MFITKIARGLLSCCSTPPTLDKSYFLQKLTEISLKSKEKTNDDWFYKREELQRKFTGRESELIDWLKEVASEKKNDPNLRVTAIRFFTRFRVEEYPEIMEHLKKLLYDKDPKIRDATVSTIGYLGKNSLETLSIMFTHFNDPDREVQATAAHYLGAYGGKNAYEVLTTRNRFLTEYNKAKEAVEDAIERIYDRNFDKVLKDLKRIASLEGTKKEAARKELIEKYINELPLETVERILSEIVLNKDDILRYTSLEQNARIEALYCLSTLGNKSMVQALANSLNEKD